MRCLKGIWVPDTETHLELFAKKENWTYQYNKLEKAVEYVKSKKLAVDIGGHIGLWSMHLVKMFDEVVAFEPVEAHRECFIQNVQGKYTLHPYALGEKEKRASIEVDPKTTGGAHLVNGHDIRVKTLDSFELKPDFIKIDVEGYELFVIQGGEQTIRTHKPVIILEQKPSLAERYNLCRLDATELLKKWGYNLRETMKGDNILSV